MVINMKLEKVFSTGCTQNHGGRESAVEISQVVVPSKYRKQVISLAYESIVGGHLGVKKTTDRISSSFHWPGITSDITRFCRYRVMYAKGFCSRYLSGKCQL